MERGKISISSILRDEFNVFLKYFIFAFVYSIIVFGLFMLARSLDVDEHVSGAFALFPVVSIILIFYILIITSFVRYVKQKNNKKNK